MQFSFPRRVAQLRVALSAICLLMAPAVQAVSSAVERYADAISVEYTTERDGQWTRLGALDVWELDIHSPGAVNLSAHIEDAALPAGAVLQVQQPGSLQAIAVYAASDLLAGGALWTARVPGDRLRLCLVVPSLQRSVTRLTVADYYRGYKSAPAPGRSGSCQVSSSCAAGSSWTAQARSVALITINGQFQCSATLLNNTRVDGDPLLLTARHCMFDGNTELPAGSVVAYWKHAEDSCGSGGNAQGVVSQSGASLLAHHRPTDATLLRLNARPPASANAFYAGWDSRLALSDSGVGLHHPRGDLRMISSHTRRPATARARIDGSLVESLRLSWAEGVTEPGSSGSPLFNDSGRLIGQLSGGVSECGVSLGPDYYGRFDLAFDADPDARLDRFLDPDRSGAQALDGVDAAAVNAPADNSGSGGISGGSGDPLLDRIQEDPDRQPDKNGGSAETGGATNPGTDSGAGTDSGGGGTIDPLLWLWVLFAGRLDAVRRRASRTEKR